MLFCGGESEPSPCCLLRDNLIVEAFCKMSNTILNSSDWERMKRSVLPDSVNDSKSRRKEELKKLSTEKYKHWPNTLDALRQKKLNFVEEKAHAEELARQEVDRQVSAPKSFDLCSPLCSLLDGDQNYV